MEKTEYLNQTPSNPMPAFSTESRVCPDCKLSNADDHYDEEYSICWFYENHFEDIVRASMEAK